MYNMYYKNITIYYFSYIPYLVHIYLHADQLLARFIYYN